MHDYLNSLADIPYKRKTAFVLNANAKSVSDKIVDKLLNVVPLGDLFYSRNMQEAENFYRIILRRGYGWVFGGGGDGTVTNMINMIRTIAQEDRFSILPKIGVLRMGTGNALAHVLKASSPSLDARHIINGGEINSHYVDMVECDDGKLAPFAGVGYDGELVNDYVLFKRQVQNKPWGKVFCSILGYMAAGSVMTIPKQLVRAKPKISIYSNAESYKIVHENGVDRVVPIPRDTMLFSGQAPHLSAGSIPCFGYGFKMFPFANKQSGFIQLRVISCSMATLIANIVGIWRGTYRHPGIHDFLIKDVVVESEEHMAYQIAGDAAGYRSQISFKASKHPILMAQLAESRLAKSKIMPGFSESWVQV